MPHAHTHLILINDVDAAGVAFFARLVAIAHEGYEHALAAAGLPIAALIREGRYGLPVVHIESDFAHPVRHGDVLVATVACERIGGSSYACRIDLVIEAEGRSTPAATVRQVHACIDVARGASTPLPEAIRAALQRL
jgi:4-hydroxybenzoyl-CoA thioesterase